MIEKCAIFSYQGDLMNRLVHRSWGETFTMIYLDLSKDISLGSSSTCGDRPFPTRRLAAASGYFFRHSHGGIGCGSTHNPFCPSRASFSNPSRTMPPGAYLRYHQPCLTSACLTCVPSDNSTSASVLAIRSRRNRSPAMTEEGPGSRCVNQSEEAVRDRAGGRRR